MPRRCVALLCAGLGLAVPAPGAADALLEDLRHCLGSAALDEHGLAGGCPAVAEQLAEDWSTALPADPAELSRAELEDLERHLSDFSAGRSPRPDPRDLDGVLAGFAEEQSRPDPRSLWQRFVAWLDSLFERDAADRDSRLADWLSRLSLPDELARIIFYVTTAALVLLAAGVVIHELARSGLLRRRRRAAATFAVDEYAHASGQGAVFSVADVEAAAEQLRPSLLLRLLLGVLARTGHLPDSRTLTHRELCQRVSLDGERGSLFASVVQSAERTMYGGQRISAQQLEALLARGRRLIASLEGAAA